MKTKRKRNFKYEVLSGDDINDTIKRAIEVAKGINTVSLVTELVEFNHNGVTVIVDARSSPELVYRDWQRALYGYIGKVVGPNYKAELSPEEVESDAKIEAEKAARRQKTQAEYQAKADAKRAKLDARLAKAPPMSFSDNKMWDDWLANRNDGDCGIDVFRYAEQWARLMELGMLEGKQLKAIAKSTSHQADVEDIAESLYDVAVSVLAKCWKYGEELRQWHNIDTQLGDEGEKANKEGGVLSSTTHIVG